jgi:hypothetical protein
MGLLDDVFDKEAVDAPSPKLLDRVVGGAIPAVGAATGISALLSGDQATPAQIDNRAIDDLLDPTHESTMQRIQMQAMLTEFLSSDPVISTYDSDQVVEAFNQITQMTPRASLQPAIMRGQIRKMLQQQDAMEPFEAGQLIDVERGLKDVSAPAELPLAALPDVGESTSGGK